MTKSKTYREGETHEARLRRDTQLDYIDEEIARVSRMIAYHEENLPRTQPVTGVHDGLYVNVAHRDHDLVLLAILRKLRELRDTVAYNGALS